MSDILTFYFYILLLCLPVTLFTFIVLLVTKGFVLAILGFFTTLFIIPAVILAVICFIFWVSTFFE